VIDAAAGAQPRLRVFAGPNGSGKSTIQALLRPEWIGAHVFDNSGEAHELIAEISEGDELTVHAQALPAWFTSTSLWQSFQTAA
jgi:predicted ABC-type ATPase